MAGPEAKFQSNLKKSLKSKFDDCYIFKTNCNEMQGAPDLLVAWRGKCGYLECKRSATASHRPNQDYRVNKINEEGGFARFIYPENRDEVLKEMEEFFNDME